MTSSVKIAPGKSSSASRPRSLSPSLTFWTGLCGPHGEAALIGFPAVKMKAWRLEAYDP
jgi:hypothetical protein